MGLNNMKIKIKTTASLRREFNGNLYDVWKVWNDLPGSPFMTLEEHPELDENAGYNYLIGWVQGVAWARGWSVDCPKSIQRKFPKR